MKFCGPVIAGAVSLCNIIITMNNHWDICILYPTHAFKIQSNGHPEWNQTINENLVKQNKKQLQ